MNNQINWARRIMAIFEVLFMTLLFALRFLEPHFPKPHHWILGAEMFCFFALFASTWGLANTFKTKNK
jgi:hypothetical protein